MEAKFKRLDEVSFTIHGQKIYGMIKESISINYESNETHLYSVVLVRPISIDNKINQELQVLEQDLIADKFPLVGAGNGPIVIS